MAQNVKVKCKILKIEDNKAGGQNVFVECSIGQRTWIKEMWCKYDRPISMEEFKRDLTKHIWPSAETDDLRYVKEKANEPFEVEVERQN